MCISTLFNRIFLLRTEGLECARSALFIPCWRGQRWDAFGEGASGGGNAPRYLEPTVNCVIRAGVPSAPTTGGCPFFLPLSPLPELEPAEHIPLDGEAAIVTPFVSPVASWTLGVETEDAIEIPWDCNARLCSLVFYGPVECRLDFTDPIYIRRDFSGRFLVRS